MGNFYETKIKDRIINYWTKRSENFAQLRQEELHSYMSELWLTEITKYLPQRPCKILDVGTGTGFCQSTCPISSRSRRH